VWSCAIISDISTLLYSTSQHATTSEERHAHPTLLDGSEAERGSILASLAG
jgi:hypothetical protein